MSPTELKKPIVTSLYNVLRPLGFTKAASVFSRRSDNLVQLIDLQGSRQNTTESAQFTVNVGIFLLSLVDEDMRDFTKPTIAGAHWRQRLGFLLQDKRDLWWVVSTLHQAEIAAHEISSQVTSYALPTLASLSNTQALIELWQTGQSPGLTEYQRKDYLERLCSV